MHSASNNIVVGVEKEGHFQLWIEKLLIVHVT